MKEEEKIQNGFNDCYLLAEHRPELMAILKEGILTKNDP